jgi:ribonuclease-3
VLEIVDRFLGEAFARAAAGTLDRDFKTQLQELSQSRLRSTPRYRVVAEHGPDHSKVFEVETDLRGEILGRGEGRSKKDAEQAAAKLALDLLGRRFAEESALPAAAPPAAAPPPPPAPEASAEVAAGEAATAGGETAAPPATAPAPARRPREKRPAVAKRPRAAAPARKRKPAPAKRAPKGGRRKS